MAQLDQISEAIGALRAESRQNLQITKEIREAQKSIQARLTKLEHHKTATMAIAALLGSLFGFGGGHLPRL